MGKGERGALVLNVGSSSIKYSIFSGLTLIDSGNYEELKDEKDYRKSIEDIFRKLKGRKIDFIIHRIVHGGEINKPMKINGFVKHKIKEFSELAPLHNPRELLVINLCEKLKKPQYAVFDTMFFQNLPIVAKKYAIPSNISEKFRIRRFGFHGLSHEFVSRGLKGRTITCHLGAGSSISAILNGKPVDTSMGFTPFEGAMMTTRSGTIDPGIIFFLEKRGYDMKKLLDNASGLKGISGHDDFREILKRKSRDKNCKLAYDMLSYSISKIIGSYIAVLHGLDNLVFTGKIGENSFELRRDICSYLEFLGVGIDKDKNRTNKEVISSGNSKIKVLVKKTNEEKIALEKVLKILK